MALSDRIQGTIFGWDSEQRATARTVRLGLFIIGLFIVSGILSCNELRYSVFGRKTTATVSLCRPAPAINSDAFTLEYGYLDNGQSRRGSYTFNSGLSDLPEKLPPGLAIDVIYIPGSTDSSKPVTARHWWAVIVFLIMTTIVALWLTLFMIQYYKDNPTARRR